MKSWTMSKQWRELLYAMQNIIVEYKYKYYNICSKYQNMNFGTLVVSLNWKFCS